MNIKDFIKVLPNQKTPFAALIGEKTYYSVSPLMHNSAAKYYNLNFDYYALDVLNNDFHLIPAVLNHDLCMGFNITIPYKKKILAFVDQKSELVRNLNAANVIYKFKNEIYAENTDVEGFIYPLQQISEISKITKAFIFGSGGASRAAEAGLKLLGIKNVQIISRTPTPNQLSYENWMDDIDENDNVVLVNGIPLGMTNMQDKSPITYAELLKVKPSICYDLIYNPSKTLFLRQAEDAGVLYCINGLEMLIRQGSAAFTIWNKKGFPIDHVKLSLLESTKI